MSGDAPVCSRSELTASDVRWRCVQWGGVRSESSTESIEGFFPISPRAPSLHDARNGGFLGTPARRTATGTVGTLALRRRGADAPRSPEIGCGDEAERRCSGDGDLRLIFRVLRGRSAR